MSYKALYRTYRPQTFQEVAGQQPIVRTLQNALASGKLAHAYLFSGPRGTGKTSMARLLAKALNCETQFGSQCNKCSNCLAITEGSHPDVIEIDAASNSGVDNVRDLIENVRYSPIKGKYKVYIIDEVHMMSSSAFNALLKTLEEPPANVIFVLATTEPHKLLPTILSRSQRFDFSKVSDADLEAKLIEILDKENVKYELPAVRLIISLADGGVRDALTMLDQVLAYSGQTLNEKDLLKVFGLAGPTERMRLLVAINDGNLSSVLKIFQEFVGSGIDIKRLTKDLIDVLKDTLIYRKTRKLELLRVLSLDDAQKLASALPVAKTETMIDVLIKAQSDFRYVADIRSIFEVTLLKLTLLEQNEAENAPVIESQPVVNKEPVTVKPVAVEPAPEKKITPTPQPVVDVLPAFTTVSALGDGDVIIDDGKPHLPPHMGGVVKEDNATPAKRDIPIAANEPRQEKPVLKQAKEEYQVKQSAIPVEIDGDKLAVDEDMLIKIMCVGNKEEKLQLIEQWPRLNDPLLQPELRNFALLLKDGTPYVLAKEVLVLNYLFETQVKKVNTIANQRHFQTLIKLLLGRNIIVYAVLDKERSVAQKKFMELGQLSMLPRARDIVIEIEGSERI